MNNNKTIEVIQVIFGLIMAVGTLSVLAYLEISLHEEPTIAHIAGIIAGAIGRFYLFVQGTTVGGSLKLSKISVKIKDLVLGLSLIISGAFTWYIYGVWLETGFSPELWYLFVILIAILTIIEWIFGLRTARLISGNLENTKKTFEKKIEDKNLELSELKRKLSAEMREFTKLMASEKSKSDRIEALTREGKSHAIWSVIGKELIQYPFIIGDKKHVKCPNCFKDTPLSPNTRIVNCGHEMEDGRVCNTKVWEKE